MPTEPNQVKELDAREFQRFTRKENLIEFEEKNRPRIISAPLSTFEKFVQKWQSIVGTTLFYAKPINMPAPLARSQDENKYINPKENNYGVVLKTEKKEVPVRRRIDGVLKVVMEEREVTTGYIADDGYWEVRFQPTTGPTDPVDVTLSVNGQCLNIQRDVAVILPGPFLECADHGTYPVYMQLPNQPRKVVGHRMHFPYIVLRRCNKSEYLGMLNEGNRLTKEARKREEQT